MKANLKTLIVLALLAFAMLSACSTNKYFGCGQYKTGWAKGKKS